MPFVLIRDSEINKLYVYTNLTAESAEHLEFMYAQALLGFGFFSIYSSDKPYDPAIAHEFLETGEVNDEHVARTPE